MKRLFLLLIVACACNVAAHAQTYPTKTIRMIAGFPPGGGTDTMARMMAQKLSEYLGQSVIVDNRPGAGGAIGAALVAKAPPDGYTLMLGSSSPLTVSPSLVSNLPYNPMTDFSPISVLSTTPNMLAVHPSLPVKTVKDLIQFARGRPGQLTFSSSGNGGSGHLAGEMFNSMAGVKMLHVPYKGTAPAAIAVISGEVTLTFGSLVTMLPHYRSGRLRGIAVTGAKRSPSAPELPTVAEAGLAGYEAGPWHAILAPPRTPREIVARLHTEIVKALRDPVVVEKLTAEGAEVVGNTPEQFTEYMKTDLQRWAKIIKAANIRVD